MRLPMNIYGRLLRHEEFNCSFVADDDDGGGWWFAMRQRNSTNLPLLSFEFMVLLLLVT